MIRLPQDAALELALWCDTALRWQAERCEIAEDRLSRMGALLGGESAKGIEHDLRDAMNRAEAEVREAAEEADYVPSRGGTDPDAYTSERLEAAIDAARDAVARDWLAAASAIRAEPAFEVAA